MDNNINAAFKRANLQQIVNFIYNGSEFTETDKRTYTERLEQDSKALNDIIESLESVCSDEYKFDKALNEALSAYQYVFTEIGMKIGAKLLFELLVHENSA